MKLKCNLSEIPANIAACPICGERLVINDVRLRLLGLIYDMMYDENISRHEVKDRIYAEVEKLAILERKDESEV